MATDTAPEGTGKIKGGQKILTICAIFLGLGLVSLVFYSQRGLYQFYLLRHERLRLDQENARLAEENARLTRTIDRLHHDPEMIQDLIRRELNFVKNNEMVVQLSPEIAVKTLSSGKDHPPPAKPAAKEAIASPPQKTVGPASSKRSKSAPKGSKSASRQRD